MAALETHTLMENRWMAKNEAVSVRGRARALAHRREWKMAASIDTYLRGEIRAFYRWLAEQSTTAILEGPPVWICGDCHIGNLGPLANDKGEVAIHIRDLDQTVIGNPAYDVIRLGLSLASLARGSAFPGCMTVKMMGALADGYTMAFAPRRSDLSPPRSIKKALNQALRREWKALARERTEGTAPTLPLSERMWPLSVSERRELTALFDSAPVKRLATQIKHRPDDGKVSFVDAAYWRKGCSSLGKLRYAVLLDVDGGTLEGDDFCLMDVKEAARAFAPHARGYRIPANHAQRVVEGARHLSPALGDRMHAAQIAGRPVFIRELLPQDMTLDLSRLREDDAVQWANFLGWIVGRSHAQQMDSARLKEWHTQLKRCRARSCHAPPWLWSSVLALLSRHEPSYLAHCQALLARSRT
jgi:uncharacterized protein (DUF2252 family)